MVYKMIVLLIFCINVIANEQVTRIHIWNKIEAPSVENNFQVHKKIYQTSNKGEAISATIMEGLLHLDEIEKKQKLTTDFKYLKEFEKNLKEK